MVQYHREIPNNFSLPRQISRLGQFAYNLWWVWNPDSQLLFANIDKPLWNKLNHNPVALLRKVEQAKLNAVASDPVYLETYERVMRNFDAYLKGENTWFARNYLAFTRRQIAYFSFEFGLHESLPVYAGGLGVLSGDHIKEASDMNMPLVGVGFVYNQGYFQQRITEDGWQETGNLYLDFYQMPIVPLVDPEGKPALISVDLPGRKVWARIWEVMVGRCSLFLLDSNVEDNSPTDRMLTAKLYSNDLDVRISQEILLGIGGVRALRLLGYNPDVWHMNEGHSAFLSLERLREEFVAGKGFEDAVEHLRKTNVFTTHTPVPAGNDQFPLWLVDKYLANSWVEMGITHEQFIDLARHKQEWGDMYSMPVLALRLSAQANAVSELHGHVSRRMWQFLWPGRREEDVPITYVTNSVHPGTWMARRLRHLFEQYLGADWMERIDDAEMWGQISNIPDAEIWALRRHFKRKLMLFANERIRNAWLSGAIHPSQVVAGGVMMEPYSLTIGFARRFATYKRGNLLLRDYDRLLRLINDIDRPLQIIYAGKAHPADEPGKLIIQQVYRAVKDHKAGGRLIFLEDYDMNVARFLVQGVDVWMNTPRRPNEASGTSGMKAAMNGVLNFSILDGWWREGYNGRNGWAIGEDSDPQDGDQRDVADAQSMYDILEHQIIPLYYERTPENVPAKWMAMVKESLRTLVPQFSMRRMLHEYTDQLYTPALNHTKAHKK